MDCKWGSRLSIFDFQRPYLFCIFWGLAKFCMQKRKAIRHSALTKMLTNLTRPSHINLIQFILWSTPHSAYLCVDFFHKLPDLHLRLPVIASDRPGTQWHKLKVRREQLSQLSQHTLVRWHSLCLSWNLQYLGMTQDWRTLKPCWSEDLRFAVESSGLLASHVWVTEPATLRSTCFMIFRIS